MIRLIDQRFIANSFLSTVSEDEDKDVVACLTILFDVYKKLFDLDEEISEDPEIKKMSSMVINTINILTDFLPDDTNPLSIQVS